MNNNTYIEEEKSVYIKINECPICLDNIDILKNDSILLQCCNYNIHNSCINKWIQNNKNKETKCPLCTKFNYQINNIRNELLNNNNNNNNNNSNIINSNIINSNNFFIYIYKIIRVFMIIFIVYLLCYIIIYN